jgi:CheY-like chemotaxis protein
MANQRALARAGYEVIGAEDGRCGLELAREQQPDLILLDMMLPKISGPEVLRALKTNPQTKAIRVIVLSSLSEKNRDKLVAEGAAGFIEKSDDLINNNSAGLVQQIEDTLRTVVT